MSAPPTSATLEAIREIPIIRCLPFLEGFTPPRAPRQLRSHRPEEDRRVGTGGLRIGRTRSDVRNVDGGPAPDCRRAGLEPHSRQTPWCPSCRRGVNRGPRHRVPASEPHVRSVSPASRGRLVRATVSTTGDGDAEMTATVGHATTHPRGSHSETRPPLRSWLRRPPRHRDVLQVSRLCVVDEVVLVRYDALVFCALLSRATKPSSDFLLPALRKIPSKR
jgi:hypothetical protein